MVDEECVGCLNVCCQSNEETALHLAILQDDGSSLYMADFIIQNSNRSAVLTASAVLTHCSQSTPSVIIN